MKKKNIVYLILGLINSLSAIGNPNNRPYDQEFSKFSLTHYLSPSWQEFLKPEIMLNPHERAIVEGNIGYFTHQASKDEPTYTLRTTTFSSSEKENLLSIAKSRIDYTNQKFIAQETSPSKTAVKCGVTSILWSGILYGLHTATLKTIDWLQPHIVPALCSDSDLKPLADTAGYLKTAAITLGICGVGTLALKYLHNWHTLRTLKAAQLRAIAIHSAISKLPLAN